MEGSSNNRQEILGMQVFNCTDCSKPLFPPVYHCSNGSFICWICHDKIPHNERVSIERCSGMERVVDNIIVACKHGCDDEIKYYQKEDHEATCPAGPCTCPVSGCGFVMTNEELFDHLTTLHELPSIDIKYFVSFQRRVEPGTCVLRGNDGALFLLDTALAAPGSLDHAISLTPVQSIGSIGCLVCFSCLDGHYQASKWNFGPGAAPTQRLCVVPMVSEVETDVELSITIDKVYKSDGIDMPVEGEDDYESEEED